MQWSLLIGNLAYITMTTKGILQKERKAMTTKNRKVAISAFATKAIANGLAAFGFVAALLVAPAALAQEASSLGTFKFWTAWKSSDANGVICYASSQPQDAQPTNVNRDPIHFLIIHRKGLGTRNEVQTLVGYPLQVGSSPSVVVDGRSYAMVVEKSAAWLASAGDENGFVDQMKRGTEMVVRGVSQRGTNTTDTYSLSGVTAAMNEIDKACT